MSRLRLSSWRRRRPSGRKPEEDEKLNICPNSACGTLNPPGERLCQRCSSPLPGAVGQVIAGKYRLEQPLATGGFGVVYGRRLSRRASRSRSRR